MARDDAQIKIYVPFEMREQIKEKAEANSRSMNAEIVAAIEAALDQPDLSAAQLRALLDEERETASRTIGIIESQFDLIDRYKHILDSAGRQIARQAGVMESLCTILLSMDPSSEIADMARRISLTSREEREKFEEKYGVVDEGPDPARLERVLNRAKELPGEGKK